MSEEVIKPSEWEKLLDFIEKSIPLPGWAKIGIAALVLTALLLVVVAAILKSISLIQELWFEKIRPRLYPPEQRQRATVRRLFARHLRREIEDRNAKENWQDDEFAELEAEVEAEGRRRTLLFFFRSPRGIRRERSLTTALERSTEKLVLVQGDPGSGKSVALRHVAFHLAEKASRARRVDSVLPVYVNLKELTRSDNQPVDRHLIRQAVLTSLNRINDRLVSEFLETNFDNGLKDGSWFFLFDSFDELADVLSSTDADDIITSYSNAISDFLGGINACRGVVASREYRGPARRNWRVFRVIELSARRQDELIRLAFMNYPTQAADLYDGLSSAADDVRIMSRNPMLLGLLCQHVRLGQAFPQTAYEVFSKYIAYRFNKDAHRVQERHNIDIMEVRAAAAKIAFSMTADPRIGLSPHRVELQKALVRQRFRLSKAKLNKVLNALEYMRIGRSDRNTVEEDEREFTFAHRRFQEYFATTVVTGEPTRVGPDQLLTDARWRDTAVVLCQTGEASTVSPLIEAALERLQAIRECVDQYRANSSTELRGVPFPWPVGALHLLSILQSGFGTSANPILVPVRKISGEILETVFTYGDFLDKKMVLDIAAVASEPVLQSLIIRALPLNSQWLNDIIFRQVARLRVPSPEILRWIRRALLRLASVGELGRNQRSVRAYIARLPDSGKLLNAALLAVWIKSIDLVLVSSVLALTISMFYRWLFSTIMSVAAATLILGVGLLFYTHSRFLELTDQRAIFFWVGSLYLCIMGLVETKLFIDVRALAMTEILYWAFLAYTFSWAPAAATCIVRGVGDNPILWPFSPLVMAIQWAIDGYRIVSKFSNLRRLVAAVNFRRAMRGIVLGVGVMGIAVTIVWGTIAAVRYFDLEALAKGILIALAIMAAVWAMFVQLIMPVFRYSMDFWILRRWAEMKHGSVDGIALVNGYLGVKTNWAKLRLLRAVRLGDRLTDVENGEEALRRLAGMGVPAPAHRDEIYRLIEQLRMRVDRQKR
jgi:hypothetical protein